MKLVIFLLLIGCASDKATVPPKKIEPVAQIDPTSIESKQLANEQESSYVRDVTFQRSRSSLGPTQKRALKDLFKDASAAGTVKEAKVLTWGDDEYPTKKTKKLSERDLKLVESRNSSISKFLKTLNPELKVTTVSMAERPSKWDEILSTDAARMKSSIEEAGIPKAGERIPEDMKAKKSTSTIIFINH